MKKLSATKAAYLAGICDGEGTINLRLTKGRLVAYGIVITNCDSSLIAQIAKMLTDAGIKTYLSPGGNHTKTGYKASWQLLIAGIDNMKLWLNAIRPYLVGKAAQADLVLKFLSTRRSGFRVLAKTEQDWFIYQELRRLNRRGTSDSVETVRGTLEKRTAMIQSELMGDHESLAEMTKPLFKN